MIRVLTIQVRASGARDPMIVTIADDGGGEYVLVSDGKQDIGIDPEEWPELRRAINAQMRRLAREGEGGTR